MSANARVRTSPACVRRFAYPKYVLRRTAARCAPCSAAGRRDAENRALPRLWHMVLVRSHELRAHWPVPRERREALGLSQRGRVGRAERPRGAELGALSRGRVNKSGLISIPSSPPNDAEDVQRRVMRVLDGRRPVEPARVDKYEASGFRLRPTRATERFGKTELRWEL